MPEQKSEWITRRTAMTGAAGLALAGAGAACAPNDTAGFARAPAWLTLLGQSEKGGRDYVPRVEGRVPADLRGALFRNGPGLFERGGYRIKHLLDGDGLIQRLSFANGKVRYQNQFVRTEKFKQEEAADERKYATWTTRKSDNLFDNIGGGIEHSQAGVTVYPVHGKILARDEMGPSYAIDPETLETLDTHPVGEGAHSVGYKAHSKIDPETGEWIIAGTQFGRRMNIHAAIYEPDLKLKTQFSFESPRQVYIHDYFVSQNYIIFLLHPCFFSPYPFLAGVKSFTDSLSWRFDEGNVIAIVPRGGGTPKFIEAPGAFMWHALNAFEESGELFLDFVGYDEPDHFVGKAALFGNLMQGYLGRASGLGKIRRYRIDLAAGSLREEIFDDGNHEFPMIDGRAAMGRHRAGYFSSNGDLGGLNSGLKRVDYETGADDTFDFGANVHVGEPVFAERAGGTVDEGWLIAQCLDGETGNTFFAVFDAQTVGQGPIVKIWLDHHVPISFHGSWSA